MNKAELFRGTEAIFVPTVYLTEMHGGSTPKSKLEKMLPDKGRSHNFNNGLDSTLSLTEAQYIKERGIYRKDHGIIANHMFIGQEDLKILQSYANSIKNYVRRVRHGKVTNFEVYKVLREPPRIKTNHDAAVWLATRILRYGTAPIKGDDGKIKYAIPVKVLDEFMVDEKVDNEDWQHRTTEETFPFFKNPKKTLEEEFGERTGKEKNWVRLCEMAELIKKYDLLKLL